MTERSARAFRGVGATAVPERAGRALDVWTPRDLGGDRGRDRARSGEIGNLPKILLRFTEIEIRSDLKSSDFWNS